MRRHIAIATSTRADWGLLSPLAAELRRRGAEVSIMATNMHFSDNAGQTWREIEADGFEIAVAIRTHGTPSEIAAQTLSGFADAFARLQPDCVVILGDRYEMVSVAMAATLGRIPIVHIAGGAVSEGAFDDCFRHSITKMARLHLTETEEYRRRVIQMGEHPDTVINTGAIGVSGIDSMQLPPLSEVAESLDIQIDRPLILVTMHAATLDPMPPSEQLQMLLDALEEYKDTYDVLITHPNNDVDPRPLIERIERYVAKDPAHRFSFPSLGHKRYLAAVKAATVVVGNSSSGIVEVPSFGTPVLDIGIRQQGRTRSEAVIHADATPQAIAAGLAAVLSKQTAELAANASNPYSKPDTLNLMANAVLSADFQTTQVKQFYNIDYEL